MTSQKKWIQISKIHNTEIKSSASSLVDIQEIHLGVGVFNYIKSKFDIPIFPIGDKLLYLYPEYAILSQSPSQFEVIDYENIQISYSIIRFQEPDSYPSDAEKLYSTWKYVNKNGGPDKRYANNPQLSVVKYGGIHISINGDLSVTYQISNASFAECFCTNYNHFINSITHNAIESSINPSLNVLDTIQHFSLSNIIQASDKIFHYLTEISTDIQVIHALDNQPKLDRIKNIKISTDNIDNRLAFVAISDLIKCFEGLGHRADMSTDEGRAIGIALTRILYPNNDVWKEETLTRQPKGQKILEDSYNAFKNNFHVEFDPEKFLLIEILRHEGIDEETINRWAILLYRYAILIAKADGHLSDTEQKWLSNILSFTKNEFTKTTNFNSSSKRVSLPQNIDPLFEDVARFIVISNIASISSIQRKYSIGYNRAGKIMDQLEEAGIVGPTSVGKPRDVIIDSIALEELISHGSTTIKFTEKIPSTTIDIDKPSIYPKNVKNKVVSNPLKELETLIGLSEVKSEINNIYNLIKVQKIRTSKGLNTPDISYHCIFTGNPGTGKTTVARLVAQIYLQLGILTKGHLIETDRSGLVAEYVGQTAVKTNKIIDSALDGVLFIDEAYSLVQNGGSNDFGLEAISTLLKRMEDERNRLVVILAGYSDEMKNFIESNPGLQSRFNRYIHFEDYTADELTSIYKFNLSKFDYRMTDDASAAIKEVMTKAINNKDNKFGNARFARNLFEKTLERQAKRLAASSLSSLTDDLLTEITKADITD